MRVVGEIANPDCKITIFSWNNRYIIKLEQGLLEQTFKVPEYDVPTESAVQQLIDAPFVREALIRFGDMGTSLRNALERS